MYKESRSFSKSLASTGNRPQKTTGWTSLKPGRASAAGAGVGDGIADAGLGDFLDLGGDEADLAGAELLQLLDLGAEAADSIDEVGRAGGHELDLLALADRAVDDPDEDDDSEIGVVPAVDEHGLGGAVGVAFGRRDLGDDGVEHFLDPDSGLGAGHDRVATRQGR